MAKKYTEDETKNLKKMLNQLVDKLSDSPIVLEREDVARISQQDFNKIIAYVLKHEAEIFRVLSTAEHGVKIKKGEDLPRAFSIIYDHQAKKIVIDIWLKNKLDEDGKVVKIPEYLRKAGESSKYSDLLTVMLDNGSLSVKSHDNGLLVKKHADNEAVKGEAAVQNALAEHDISLPVTVMPAEESEKLSKKTSNGKSLLDLASQPGIDCTNFPKYYRHIIERTAKLHALGLVHGDLKPENTIIYKEQAYLADLDTLGFVNDLHPLQGTPGYLLPQATLSDINYQLLSSNAATLLLPQGTLPSEVRKAICYNYASDLYAVAITIRDANQLIDPWQQNETINEINKKIQKYLDVTAVS